VLGTFLALRQADTWRKAERIGCILRSERIDVAEGGKMAWCRSAVTSVLACGALPLWHAASTTAERMVHAIRAALYTCVGQSPRVYVPEVRQRDQFRIIQTVVAAAVEFG